MQSLVAFYFLFFAAPERTVFIGSNLSDENLVTFSATIAAADPDAVLLLDSPKSSLYTKSFLESYHATKVVLVGSFPNGVDEVQRRLGIPGSEVVEWKGAAPIELWKRYLPSADRLVICPPQPRPRFLQAATLAGVLRAPFVVVADDAEPSDEIKRQLQAWHAKEVLSAMRPKDVPPGAYSRRAFLLPGARRVSSLDEDGIFQQTLKELRQTGAPRTLVVANPDDLGKDRGGMSALAPWVACQHRAPLLLTNSKGDDGAEVVATATSKHPSLRHADWVIWTANLQAIPMERRPNPVPGKDPFIEMEALTPKGSAPFSFASGRLFHEDRAVVLSMVARARLLDKDARNCDRALIVSNPGGGLPLLETFSRNTAKEMANAGYQTTALFEDNATKDDVRRLLPNQAIFLWEGHHQTMVRDFGLPLWSEPLSPSLIFLQSCLALNEAETQTLFNRGALAVVGSSTRTYSASGGAFTLAFFDALFYGEESLGGSLRQAKNFLLAYSLLKDKRLGPKARLSGANLRSAWAFTLWGDPTVRLPQPAPPSGALPHVLQKVTSKSITITVPEAIYDKVAVGDFRAQLSPNARLAGLLSPDDSEEAQHLVPLLFAEVHLPGGPPDQEPHLHCRLPDKNWQFLWDSRRRTGYLLIAPRAKDPPELRFRIDWEQ